MTRWPSIPSLTTRVSSAFMLTVSRLMLRRRLMNTRATSTDTGSMIRMIRVSTQDMYSSTQMSAITTRVSRTSTEITSVA